MELQYVVTYEYCGDDEYQFFDDSPTALNFIKENVNSANYGEFRLFTETRIYFLVV